MKLTLFLFAAALSLHAQVMQWTRYETALQAEQAYANALADVEVDAEFRSPSGRLYRVAGFWDGGSTWRVRFSPDEPGEWTWSTRPSTKDAGLTRGGTFRCVPYKGSNPVYSHGALRVAPGGHYLMHDDGKPFFWLGDTVWNGVLLSHERDWKVFLEDRQKKGFNVIQYIATHWSGSYADATGRVAYTGRERIELDPTFFQRMDARVNAINEAGLFAAAALLWSNGRKDISPGLYLPDDQAILLGRYMVARYGAHQVIWFLNGDGNYSGENAERWKRIGKAVFERAHPGRVSSMHTGRMRWMTEEFASEPWFQFNTYQSGHRDDDEHLRWHTEGPPATSWKRARPIPDINVEPHYEAHRSRVAGATHVFTAADIRRAVYWSLLVAPPAGVTYGGHGIWSWEQMAVEPLNHKGTGVAAPWFEAMKLPGSTDMKRVRDLFSSMPWWTLRPAQELLGNQPGGQQRKHWIAVSRTEDGSRVLAYTPAGDPIQFKADFVGGVKGARWLNPRSGEWSRAGAQGGRYTPPDKQDWVLQLSLASKATAGPAPARKPTKQFRVLVSTDLGGDPDDIQSLYRLLHYSDVLRVEGIVSTPGPGAIHSADKVKDWIRKIDIESMRRNGHPELMPESTLLSLVKQGAQSAGAPSAARRTAGSDWIIRCAKAADSRPLWVLTWGAATDVAQALHDDPSIASKIRLYTIGANNTRSDAASRQYILDNLASKWPNLFWIENGDMPNGSRDTFRGVYQGGEQLGEWNWVDFVRFNIRPHGEPGRLFPLAGAQRAGLKEGDSPSMLYLLSAAVGGAGNVDDPTAESWGGRFRYFDRSKFANYYVDLDSKSEAQESVSKWRVAFLNDWKRRWSWYDRPAR